MKAVVKTNFQFPKQKSLYVGKVRDVYNIDDKYMAMVVSDRISAFDVVLPKGIPYKGQVLNQIAAKFLDATADILPNWKLATPDPMVTVGLKCEGFRVEMIVRGYLAGSAWREYKAGARTLCGVPLPEGMVENQKFPSPIVTPTTKADEGHDENISREEIIRTGLVSKEDYEERIRYSKTMIEKWLRQTFRLTDETLIKSYIELVTPENFLEIESKFNYMIDILNDARKSSKILDKRAYLVKALDNLFKSIADITNVD